MCDRFYGEGAFLLPPSMSTQKGPSWIELTKEELKLHQDAKVCYISRKRILKKFANDKNYRKVREHCHFEGKYRAAVHNICNEISMKWNLNEISVVFHNGSNYDYCFIIKEFANEFEGKFEYLRKNTKSTKLFLLQQKEKLPILIKMAMKVLPLYLTE